MKNYKKQYEFLFLQTVSMFIETYDLSSVFHALAGIVFSILHHSTLKQNICNANHSSTPVPRDNLLDKFSTLAEDGTLTSDIKSARARYTQIFL